MKKAIALLLLCQLLLSLFLPSSFAAEPEALSLETLSAALEYAQAHPNGALSEATVSEAVQHAPAKRLKQDDNLIFPAPLMDGLVGTTEWDMPIMGVLLQTGKAEQYYCIAIYSGKSTQGEPVATHIGAFETTPGLCEYTQYWDTAEMSYGTYTVVYFTAQGSGDSLLPIEGSGSSVEISLQQSAPYLEGFSITDWDTGDTLNTLHMQVGEIAYLALRRSPAHSRAGGNIYTYHNGPFRIEEYSGLLIVQATDCGWGKLKIEYNDEIVAEIELTACVDAQGHQENAPVIVREPSADIDGLTVHSCTLCGAFGRETMPCYSSYFWLFRDVPENAWFYEPVYSAVNKNLFRGVSKKHFEPETKMTRAMLVTVLWRYEGSPQVSGTPFSDVRAKDWYAVQVAWAAQNGVVNGVGNGKFDPEGEVTREQMAAILYRYAQKKKLDTTARGELKSFADQSKVSAWAKDALSWTVGSGIIGGSKEGSKLLLKPLDGATRAEVAAILVRFIDNIADPLPPMEAVDPTGAEDSGTIQDEMDINTQWAFFPDGTLVIGGTGPIRKESPWNKYAARIKTVKVLYGPVSLHQECFRGYYALETVELSDSVNYIAAGAFRDCTALRNVKLPETLRYIESNAFENCSSLTELSLPHDLIQLGDRAFADCVSLKHMELPDAIITEAMMETYRRGIGSEIFMNCTALESVSLPLALEHIPEGCFFGCKSLTEVKMSNLTYGIREGAFHGCESIEEIVLSESITLIRPKAFNACTNLKKITVLNPYLYYYWTNLFPEYYEGGEWPFGDPAQVTVCGYTGSTAQELAAEYGYSFEALAE